MNFNQSKSNESNKVTAAVLFDYLLFLSTFLVVNESEYNTQYFDNITEKFIW